MDYLPVFLNIKGRKCVLVGGGTIALRKATLLARAGASLFVVALQINDSLQELLKQGNHSFRLGAFSAADLDGACLVIGASNDAAVNIEVSRVAHRNNIPVNIVDAPELCSVIFPAIIERSPVTIAISSSGRSPILTRKIKEQIEALTPERLGDLADLLGEFRGLAKQRIPDFSPRKKFWEDVLDSNLTELVYSGQAQQARDFIVQQLKLERPQAPRGEVYLVGAGPGDPDLLTLRALRLMQKADVVLFDRLVANEILQKIRPDAEQIHVGKARANHVLEQEQINEMLVRFAKQGKRVLRLKGGDPFIFGRGGEEIESLMQHQIPFQVVPGITAASGCASYAGIPLTHRDHSQSVHFLTGHYSGPASEPNWPSLIDTNQTLVFYMGLLNLPDICQKLINHGLAESTPVALIQQGTTRTQKVLTGSLASLPGIVAAKDIKAPTLIIVGGVVRLREKLAWFSDNNGET